MSKHPQNNAAEHHVCDPTDKVVNFFGYDLVVPDYSWRTCRKIRREAAKFKGLTDEGKVDMVISMLTDHYRNSAADVCHGHPKAARALRNELIVRGICSEM